MGNRCSCIGQPDVIQFSDQIEVIYIEDKNRPQEETAPIQETSLDVASQIIPEITTMTSCNDRVKLIESRLGPYKFDPLDNNNSTFYPPTQLSNRCIFSGQKDNSGLKCGKGIFLWSDGSKYTGY